MLKKKLSFIRADSSLDIGTGHVMRCLTIADALQLEQYEVVFICRNHEGNLISAIKEKGFEVITLENVDLDNPDLATDHSKWLSTSQLHDATQACSAMASYLQNSGSADTRADLLIVDHYAIDKRWELQVSKLVDKLLVIDDLADRPHSCHFLIDQTLDREASAYSPLVSSQTKLLLGSEYSLLRPDFAKYRSISLARKRYPINNVLISMGGVDRDNISSEILYQLESCSIARTFNITLLLGSGNPWKEEIERICDRSELNVTIKHNISNMAELLSQTDLVFGAAGTTSWERCCLGIPTVMFVIAKNQEFLASQLDLARAVVLANKQRDEQFDILKLLASLNEEVITNLSTKSAKVTNGRGVNLLIKELLSR